MPVLSSLEFVRRKGDPQVYVSWLSDVGRDAGYNPISNEELVALGVSDKNIKYAGKVDGSLIREPVTKETLQGWGRETMQAKGNSALPEGVTKSGSFADLLASGQPLGDAVGTFSTNFDPTTPQQERDNQSVAATMQQQYANQQALEAQTAAQPTGGVPMGGASPIGADGGSAGDSPASPPVTNQPYTIQKGDTLSALAKKNGTTVDALLKANPQIKNPNLIYAGAQLNLPSSQPQAQQSNNSQPQQPGGASPVASGDAPQSGAGPSPSAGSPGAGGGTTPQTPTNGQDPNKIAEIRNQLQTQFGVDSSMLSDQQATWLGMMSQVMTKNAQNNKGVLPPSLSQADMDKFLADAKTELDPYYQEQFDINKADFLGNMGLITGETQAAEQQQAEQFTMQDEALANQMAEAGTAQSGIRKLAEERQARQQKGLVESQRRQLQRQMQQIGLQAEAKFGQGGLDKMGGPPSVTSQAYDKLGLAAQPLAYTPLGIKLGSAGAEQATAIQQSAQQKGQNKLQAGTQLLQSYSPYTGQFTM